MNETQQPGEELSVLAGLLPEESQRGAYTIGDAATDRLVSTLARRMCLRHPCTAAGAGKPLVSTAVSACCAAPMHAAASGRYTCASCGELCLPRACLHRNHRRDMEYLQLMLEALDVSGEIAGEEDYAGKTTYVTMSRREAAQWVKDTRP